MQSSAQSVDHAAASSAAAKAPAPRPLARPQSAALHHHHHHHTLRRGPHPASTTTSAPSSTTASTALVPHGAGRIRARPSTAHSARRADVPAAVSPSRALIAARVLREEIESQRRVTRHAQREYNALKVALQRKREQVELVRRHLRAFDVESLPVSPPKTAPDAPTDQLKAEIHRVDGYRRRLTHLLDRLRRHERFLLATVELLGAQQRQAQRECALFQDKLAMERKVCADLACRRSQLEDSRAAHATHAALQLRSLRDEIASRRAVHTQRVEADQRREEMLRLVEARPPPPSPPAPRDSNNESDGRHSVSSPGKRDSHSRRNSLTALLQDSAAFLSAVQQPHQNQSASGEAAATSSTPPTLLHRNSSGSGSGSHSYSSNAGAAVATLLTAGGSSMLASSRRLQQLFQQQQQTHAQGSMLSELASSVTLSAHRESLFQIYETQYARVLRETGESDLSIVVDRFLSFSESLKRLQQIERELGAEHSALEARRTRQQQLVQRLRFSGIAEVEKRKRIRDFLEQQHYLKGLVKAQTKEAFVEQLKTFSCTCGCVLRAVDRRWLTLTVRVDACSRAAGHSQYRRAPQVRRRPPSSSSSYSYSHRHHHRHRSSNSNLDRAASVDSGRRRGRREGALAGDDPLQPTGRSPTTISDSRTALEPPARTPRGDRSSARRRHHASRPSALDEKRQLVALDVRVQRRGARERGRPPWG
ncbi:hypothetical protein PINS_up011076 [Pythium insidiosum]|nr:hypothetical protein PINS_up011076 [Pythium insidiosum]